MGLTELVASVLLHMIPIFAVLVFYPVVRKPLWRRLYIRLGLCFMAFWFGYYVLPVLLFGSQYSGSTFDLSEVYNPWLSAIGYYLTVFLNLGAIFIRTVLFVMPFAFLFAPIISIIILMLYLRGEKGSFRVKISEISYRYESGPIQKVKERLAENVWKEEKELFKLMIVFLPISLYLLTLVLAVSQVAPYPLIGISPQLAVFIEDLVAYLAGFLAAVYLLYSSKLSFRGRSLGDKIRFSINRFLLTTGTILAFFSVIAYVAQKLYYPGGPEALIGLAYFVIHYVMIAVIFAILLPLFEPFGSLVLVKMLSTIGRFKPKDRLKSIFSRRTLIALVSGLVASSAALLIHLLLSVVESKLGPSEYFGIPLIGKSLSFSEELVFIRLFIFFSLKDMMELLIISVILIWFVRQLSVPVFGTVLWTAAFSSVYLAVSGEGVAASLIPASLKYYWVTGVPVVMSAPGFYLPASRLGTLLVEGPLMSVGAALFMSLSPTLLLLFLVYLIKYWRNPLVLSKDVREENIVERAYWGLAFLPSLDELKHSPKDFAFSYRQVGKTSAVLEGLTPEAKDDVQKLTGRLSKGGFVGLSELADDTNLREKRLYEILRYLVSQHIVGVYNLEIESVTYRAAPQSLFITTTEGLDVFSYTFGALKIDPALISGMLTAIISFVKEATRSRQSLRTIEHGDVVLVVEYGRYVFGTIVTDQETPDLRIKLRKFLDKFELKHIDALSKWTGELPDVDKDKKLVESIFKQ